MSSEDSYRCAEEDDEEEEEAYVPSPQPKKKKKTQHSTTNTSTTQKKKSTSRSKKKTTRSTTKSSSEDNGKGEEEEEEEPDTSIWPDDNDPTVPWYKKKRFQWYKDAIMSYGKSGPDYVPTEKELGTVESSTAENWIRENTKLDKVQEFAHDNTTYCCILIEEDAVPLRKDGSHSCSRTNRGKPGGFKNYLCGCDGKHGHTCNESFGCNKYNIYEKGTPKDEGEEVFVCALFEKEKELKSYASSLVGDIVPIDGEPMMVEATGTYPDGVKGPMPVLVGGGDIAFAKEAVEKIGLVAFHYDTGDKETMDKWLKEGMQADPPMFVTSSEKRGSLNLNSGLNATAAFWSRMKKFVSKHPRLNQFYTEMNTENTVNSCWAIHYVSEEGLAKSKLNGKRKRDDEESDEGEESGSEDDEVIESDENSEEDVALVSNKRGKRKREEEAGDNIEEKNQKKKKRKLGRHDIHPDQNYMGEWRAILSLAKSRESKHAQKIMRITDRKTGRWFDLVVKDETVVAMNRIMGGVENKRYMHEIRDAAGTYTLCIEYSERQ